MEVPSSQSSFTESVPFLPRETDLDDGELEKFYPQGTSPVRSRGWKQSLVFFLTFTLALVLGLAVGSGSWRKWVPSRASIRGYTPGTLLPLPDVGSVTQVWQHNLTFSGSPTPESEEAWGSIIPMGRGFIHQEELAPFISNVAVFHQLHCLHAVLVAYYHAADNLERALNGSEKTGPAELYGTRIHTDHIRHCFDYLRRSVMCASDTNLEVIDVLNRTTNGWGQEKKCRDYSKVYDFAVMYANSTDTGIVT